MKKRILSALLACVLALSGCGSILNREYADSKPHSATYFDSEDRSVLRVESYQDLVNGILMLISDRAAEGTVWLYPGEDAPDAGEAVERACNEVQQDTPMGSYATAYLVYTVDETSHNYSVVHLTIGYRRSAEQVASMVHATSVSALYDLLAVAARNGDRELVIQVGYFDQTQEEVRSAVERIQLETVLGQLPPAEESEQSGEEDPEESAEEAPPAPALPEGVQPWQVNFYPAEGGAGIVEVLLENG